MPRKRDELDEPTKINAPFEDALAALLNDPELPPVGQPFTEPDDTLPVGEPLDETRE